MIHPSLLFKVFKVLQSDYKQLLGLYLVYFVT